MQTNLKTMLLLSQMVEEFGECDARKNPTPEQLANAITQYKLKNKVKTVELSRIVGVPHQQISRLTTAPAKHRVNRATIEAFDFVLSEYNLCNCILCRSSRHIESCCNEYTGE